MSLLTYEDQTFERVIYGETKVNWTEFQNCNFIKCDLSNSDFCNNRFIDCTFEGCNLSMVKLGGATLNNMVCKDCKVIGVNFGECDDFLFQVRFENCTLDYTSFMGKKMTKTRFIKTSLKEVNFAQANLSGSIFQESDLSNAVFNGTDISSANFSTAFNYSFDPELNIVKKAVFSMDGLPGLLFKYNIKII
jgi:uncharacterized protein YjbI with pentapeptide repeats